MPEIAGITIEEADISPAEKALVFHQELVLTETTERNLRKILYPLLEGHNLLLVGDAGVGKNALIYYINRVRSLPTIRFSFNQDTLPEDLTGSFRILPTGFVWNNGPLVEAMLKGYTFVADEMNLASPEILKRFASVFEQRSLALLEKDGSILSAHPRFNFVATQNPARGFEGRKNLPESITRHFTTIYLDQYPAKEEQEILRGLYPAEYAAVADRVVLLQRALESALWKNELAKNDWEHYHFNLRTAQRALNRAVVFSITDVESVAFRNLIFAFYVDSFRLAEDRKLALNTIAQVLKYNAAALERDYALYLEQNPAEEFWQAPSPEGRLFFPLTKNRAQLLEKIDAALAAGDNLLLEGEEAARIAELCHSWAALRGRQVTEIFLARGMHTSDIIGALRPDNTKKEGNAVRWIDGPLTAALRRHDVIILDNIDAAGSELVEKLNMLLDHAGRLVLPPEAEGETVLLKEGDCRIIATKRTRRSRNQQTISRALRNRFFNIHVPVPETEEEIAEILRQALDKEFGSDSSALREELVTKLARFHCAADRAAADKELASSFSETLRYREEHVLRLVAHTARYLGSAPLADLLRRGVEIYYAGMLSQQENRNFILRLFDRIFADLPWEDLLAALAAGKKKVLSQRARGKNKFSPPDWDKKKHFREALTGRAEKRLSGPELKKGLRINTPETGGNIKEGPDAWYGSDTQGNHGQGEPAGGGGAWGYRTEYLFQEFLKKYKPKWEYHMGYTLRDFYEAFGRLLAELRLNLENALDAEPEIERRLGAQGHRIDARRYLTYLAESGSDHIFDRTRIRHAENKLKGLEFIFAIAKGRRLFNFKSAVSAVVALQSAVEILWDLRIPLKVFGYSDFDNFKRAINLEEYLATNGEEPAEELKERLFACLNDDWHGDTVDEVQTLRHLAREFSPEATTRFIVIVSDFRGHRARAELAQEITSTHSRELHQLVRELARENIHILAVQTGTRAIAEHIFPLHIWIHEESFDQAPLLLAQALEKMILSYHRVVV